MTDTAIACNQLRRRPATEDGARRSAAVECSFVASPEVQQMLACATTAHRALSYLYGH